jgi:hypothetical protein
MSQLAHPAAKIAQPTAAPAPTPAAGLEVKVLGESDYDKVTSLLMAIVMGAIMVVGWLALVYISNQAYASRVTPPLQIIPVFGGGGGTADGTPGSTEKIETGGDIAPMASNNEEAAGDFEEPAVQETPSGMLDAVADTGKSLAEVDIGAVMPSGGAVASGKKASKLGSGGPGLGFGPGDGGIADEQRWSIIYKEGQSADEYARQLDALGVQLAVIAGADQLLYVSNFSSATPTKRQGSNRTEHRLYFLWQGRGRKVNDIELLRKADVQVGEGVVFQFYPAEAALRLAELEVRYRGRQPAEIRVTRFTVVPKGGTYDFEVVAQETLR